MDLRPLVEERLRALVRHARECSPFYARRYAGLPRSPALAALPVVDKAELMASFGDWCADRAVRRADVERFLADRSAVGGAFLGRYTVWKSSGTTGAPGIFVQDAHAMAVYETLVAAQLDADLFAAPATLSRAMARIGRAALVVATGDHFASIAAWEHQRRMLPSVPRASFDVTWPIARLAREIEAYDPAFLASYPSMLQLLAQERIAGRLAISPAVVWSGGETLTAGARRFIARAFGCRVVNEYGASECLSIACECREGWLHANTDWVIVEGVDARGKPSRPGELSHTILITNLANHVQPLIRYDLGDRLELARGRCACGNPSAAFRVEGRSDPVLDLRTANGAHVRLVPLALSTIVEEAGVEQRFQLAQVGPDALALRLDAPAAPAWRLARPALRRYLASQGLPDAKVRLDPIGPRLDRASGKLRAVVVETGKSSRLDVSQRGAAGAS
jgi:phenylacetate-CoA ligase